MNIRKLVSSRRRKIALAAGMIFGLLTVVAVITVGILFGRAGLFAGVSALAIMAVGLSGFVYLDVLRHHRQQQRRYREIATTLKAELTALKRIEATDSETRQIKSVSAELEQFAVRLEAAEVNQRRILHEAAWARAVEARRRAQLGEQNDQHSIEDEVALIADFGLFDADFYAAQLGFVPSKPLEHYVEHAATRGFDPHPLFSATWYVTRVPDALVSWRTPLAHFAEHSLAEPLDPHPIFASRWYAETYGVNTEAVPVLHFLESGWREGNSPNWVFDTRWYLETYQSEIPDGVNPLVHYVTEGAQRNLDPSPLFSTVFARKRLGESDHDPLSTFLEIERSPDGRMPQSSGAGPLGKDGQSWEYLARGLHREPDTFVLYRIIGNDLPPRHRAGQTLENLRFVLENESDFPNVEKRWVLNRIVEPETEKAIVALLEKHGQEYLRIPFDPEAYKKSSWRFKELASLGPTYGTEFAKRDELSRERIIDHVYHDKNLYVMNNNGARNAALRDGRGRAKWVLPWDGNCFLTESAWSQIASTVVEQPYHKYFTTPMARVLDNAHLLDASREFVADEEPQLIFRKDAAEEFNPDYRYGRRPKVELFWRLGIAGIWDSWPQLPWDVARRALSPEAGQVGEAGWVARLYSGESQLEKNFAGRGTSRIEAIRARIDSLDVDLTSQHFDPADLFALDAKTLAVQTEKFGSGDAALDNRVEELIEVARGFLDQPTYSVVQKKSMAPSGDAHDYWHPAPYWWPNPRTRNGLPYIRKDGKRVPGTQFGEKDADMYDRSALQAMIDETTLSALAGKFSGDPLFYERGRSLLTTWFVDPATRMNPHMNYSQVRRGHNNDQGASTGIIEASDFYYMLDAVRILRDSGALDNTEYNAVHEWFSEYREWLRTSPQGIEEASRPNNHGTWFDVQAISIDAFLGDIKEVLHGLRRAHERIGFQFEKSGRQPEELSRSQTQHYCAYNLQGWITLSRYAERVGQDMWSYVAPNGASLPKAVSWTLSHMGKPWPYEQIEPFDEERLQVLALEARDYCPEGSLPSEVFDLEPSAMKARFSPHDAIRPYWMLAGP